MSGTRSMATAGFDSKIPGKNVFPCFSAFKRFCPGSLGNLSSDDERPFLSFDEFRLQASVELLQNWHEFIHDSSAVWTVAQRAFSVV
jgi:hypothetical protein